jgi:hypothetical protein
MHSINDVGTSKYHDVTILGNNHISERIHEISINYLESRESYDRKTTIIDICFSTMIAEILKNHIDPKTMAECNERFDWNQWKDAIQAQISLLSINTYTSTSISCGI